MSASPGLARTPEPPYHAVIFTSKRSPVDERTYGVVAQRMVDLGSRYAGFLGIESARGSDGVGITVSYWRDEASILAWKRDTEHEKAQRGGREAWYDAYEVRVARVERAYGFAREPAT
ncbi:antibiotic biosynthesis monooxygenase family protein [Horticoccus sp. 23ND18S-11]|uniref:antibiotic biosynthesis monooxygenase family protein n=1 Tax=Horticoccus sp. 23ND18S-11 TaxID=3391832 RepID=UPI0039C9BCC6